METQQELTTHLLFSIFDDKIFITLAPAVYQHFQTRFNIDTYQDSEIVRCVTILLDNKSRWSDINNNAIDELIDDLIKDRKTCDMDHPFYAKSGIRYLTKAGFDKDCLTLFLANDLLTNVIEAKLSCIQIIATMCFLIENTTDAIEVDNLDEIFHAHFPLSQDEKNPKLSVDKVLENLINKGSSVEGNQTMGIFKAPKFTSQQIEEINTIIKFYCMAKSTITTMIETKRAIVAPLT